MMRAVIGKSGSKAVPQVATLDERTVTGGSLPGAKAATHLETRKIQGCSLVEKLNCTHQRGTRAVGTATNIGYRSIFPDKTSTSS